MDRMKRVPGYVASLPERTARAGAAVFGGALKEGADLALPDAIRDSRLYQVTFGRLLRIIVEGVGGVQGEYPADAMPVGELFKRKAAGNVIEIASIVATGLSPVWVLAAASDIVGGSKAYLTELVEQLRADGLLPADADITDYDELLNRLEASSQTLSDAVDVPPLNVADARRSFDTLREQARDLPGPDELAAFWTDLRATARREGVSPIELSAAIGAAAARAGKEIGSVHLADYYRQQLDDIRDAGLLRWMAAAARPYMAGAAGQFDPGRESWTEKGLDWLSRRREARRAPDEEWREPLDP